MRRAMYAFLTVVAFFIVPFASAQNYSREEIRLSRQDPRYFTINTESIVLEKLGPSPASIIPQEGDTPVPLPEDPTVIFERIINIGKAIWEIIEANKPVVDIKTQFATAVPEGITHPGQLAGWKTPEGTLYRLRVKNLYGIEVVNVTYQVLRTCGGNYKGKGRYLAAVSVLPVSVEVAWGYRFALNAEVPSTTNVGTVEDPVAAMMLILDWRVETVLKHARGTGLYHVQGDGVFKDISGKLSQKFDPARIGLPLRPEAVRW